MCKDWGHEEWKMAIGKWLLLLDWYLCMQSLSCKCHGCDCFKSVIYSKCWNTNIAKWNEVYQFLSTLFPDVCESILTVISSDTSCHFHWEPTGKLGTNGMLPSLYHYYQSRKSMPVSQRTCSLSCSASLSTISTKNKEVHKQQLCDLVGWCPLRAEALTSITTWMDEQMQRNGTLNIKNRVLPRETFLH